MVYEMSRSPRALFTKQDSTLPFGGVFDFDGRLHTRFLRKTASIPNPMIDDEQASTHT